MSLREKQITFLLCRAYVATPVADAVLLEMLLLERAGDIPDSRFEEPTVRLCSLAVEQLVEELVFWNSVRKPFVDIQIRDSNSFSTI